MGNCPRIIGENQVKFKITEVQQVQIVYTWEVDVSSKDAAYAEADEDVPDYAIKEEKLMQASTGVESLHTETYLSDRMTTICVGCNEELGR